MDFYKKNLNLFSIKKTISFNIMRKFIITFIFLLFTFSNSFAEVIENKVQDERNFGPWQVLCREDVMMANTTCKAFSKFYNNLATVYIQPHNKVANQVVIIIPPVLENTEVKVRIDKNEIIKSRNLSKDNYGVVPFSSRDQKIMLQQIKNGKEFFIRFTIKGNESDKSEEVTVKISLAEFNNMLTFYDQKISK